MDIPPFNSHQNAEFKKEDLSTAFQRLAHELLLLEYPDLHSLNPSGKDVGIDLFQTRDASSVIVECKYIASDGYQEALRRWRSYSNTIKTHAFTSSEQLHASPSFLTNPTIDEYVFCISSTLANQDQIDNLQQEISRFFIELSTQNSHLSHLMNLSVRVLDWNDLYRRLVLLPNILFRWFPSTLPQGFEPLDRVFNLGGFRSYLSSDRLPYYSINQHLKDVPPTRGVALQGEESLLSWIGDDDTTGLIVTGSGGVGKTRLTLEIGRLAEQKAWLVLRVVSRLREDALENLARRINPNTSVLLLIDYVETRKDFAEIIDGLIELNHIHSLHLRYVATCRTSYYPMIAATPRHKKVDLSPPDDSALGIWLESYKQQTVRHILRHSGLEINKTYLKACRNVPVLAVFISYLHSTGRQLDLSDLLDEADFSQWVAKRIQLSFDNTHSIVNRNLALLMALSPLSEVAVTHPEMKGYRELLSRLMADGWMERIPADELTQDDMWVTAHDAIANQILLSYLKSIPFTIDFFVHELFSLARKIGVLRSALITLQRLSDSPLLGSVNWLSIITKEMNEDPMAWRNVRDIIIRLPLLTPSQRIILLGNHAAVWSKAEEDTDFQNALSWLIKWAIKRDVHLTDEQKFILDSWLQKAAKFATTSNIVITWGLRFNPDLVVDAALNWANTRPTTFQTHYLLVAWLKRGLPLEYVQSSVMKWLSRFSTDFHLSFLVRAWLGAGGSTESIQGFLSTWLVKHKSIPEAAFLYSAWLDAGGNMEFIQEPIAAWLSEHKTTARASFVYNSWLNAGGSAEFIQEPLRAWIIRHGTSIKAAFIYRSWLDAGGDRNLIQAQLKTWFAEFGSVAEASFVWRAWLDAGGDKELVREPIAAWLAEHGNNIKSSFIYRAWLNVGGDKELVQKPIAAWLAKHTTRPEAQFIYSAWLNAGGDKELVREPIAAWLAEHGTSAESSFIYRAWLYAGGGKKLVQEPIAAWLAENKHTDDAWGVYSAWLDAGGAADSVGDASVQLLQPVPPESLIESFTVNESVLFAGAGLSISAGVPSWETVIRELLKWAVANKLIEEDHRDSYDAAINRGDINSVAEGISTVLQSRRALLSNFLREMFAHPATLPESHHILRTLNFSAVLTTNFDNLLELAFEKQSAEHYTPQDAESLLEALHKREFFILKLHGNLEQPNTIIVSPSQIQDVIENNLPFSRFIETLFFSRTVLFVGYSLEVLQETLQNLGLRRHINRLHYALVSAAEDGWQTKAEVLARRYKIKILPYLPSHGHPQVTRFLRYLRRDVVRKHSVTKMHTQETRLNRVYLENIGPFDNLELRLDDRWNILLGDNGVGKSSILKAIGIGICGKDAQSYAGRLIKAGKSHATIILETSRNTYKTELFRTVFGPAELNVIPGRPLEAENWLAIGFPPIRSVSWNRPKGPELIGKGLPTPEDILPLIESVPDPRLDQVKQWLVNLDYRSKDEQLRTGSGGIYEKILNEYFHVVAQLTEGLTIKRGAVMPDTNEINIITDDGVIPFESISQGTASLIGWAGILLQRLYEIYGEEVEEPRLQYALILMDEIDTHMHPAWQQSLVYNLGRIFPNVQFIATTHSPLIVGGMPAHQVFRFIRDEEGKVIQLHIDPDMTMGRTDQILTGELFSLKTTLDTVTQNILERYKILLGKTQRKHGEEEEFQQIRKVLQFRIPMSTDNASLRRELTHRRNELIQQINNDIT